MAMQRGVQRKKEKSVTRLVPRYISEKTHVPVLFVFSNTSFESSIIAKPRTTANEQVSKSTAN